MNLTKLTILEARKLLDKREISSVELTQLTIDRIKKIDPIIGAFISFDEDLDSLVADNVSKAELKVAAVKKGFKSMKDDGILKVLDGVTDLASVGKVVDLRR